MIWDATDSERFDENAQKNRTAFIFFQKGDASWASISPNGFYLVSSPLSFDYRLLLSDACHSRQPVCQRRAGRARAVMERLNEKYGLDQPLYKQYFTYLDQILHGDFGISYKNSSVQVNDLIERGMISASGIPGGCCRCWSACYGRDLRPNTAACLTAYPW